LIDQQKRLRCHPERNSSDKGSEDGVEDPENPDLFHAASRRSYENSLQLLMFLQIETETAETFDLEGHYYCSNQ